MSWHKNRKTIPPLETPPERVSQHSNEQHDAENAAQARLLIGQALTLLSCIGSSASLLEQVAQSSLATPKTVEAMSYALWVTVNLTMSICVQLRMLANTLPPSLPTSPNREEITWVVNKINEFLSEVVNEFDL
jgi:hypothetical protein